MNVLTRDELIHRALDAVASPQLNRRERPDGILQQDAMSIAWLRDALGYVYLRFPFGGSLSSAALTINAATSTVPSDYMIDVRNGIRITAPLNNARRLMRTPLQMFLTYSLQALPSSMTGTPQTYTITGTTIRYYPTPDQTYTGDLWYYARPAEPTATTVIAFPDEWAMIELLKLRGKEWTKEVPDGSAIAYASQLVAALVEAGIGVESENDQIDYDPNYFRPTGNSQFQSYDWMGTTVPR